MNLDDVAAELLARPLDQFTAERNTRAKELKAQGQAELAGAVTKLKKPPVHLWAANRAARQDAGLLRTLREAAEEVTRTQTGRSTNPRELRAASERFQERLDDAVKAADDVLRKDGHGATEEAERRIREIFRVTAMQDGQAWEQLKEGALLTEPAGGDDVLAMFQAGAPAPSPTLPRERGREIAPDPHEVRAAERTARLDAERAEQLEATARRLRTEADEAAAQAERADERARDAEKDAAAARAQATKSARAVTPPRPSAARRK
ncbi:MAG TPA: hypothetical protein VIT43_00160 [Candidatus Dormibacteraeota bacterium]